MATQGGIPVNFVGVEFSVWDYIMFRAVERKEGKLQVHMVERSLWTGFIGGNEVATYLRAEDGRTTECVQLVNTRSQQSSAELPRLSPPCIPLAGVSFGIPVCWRSEDD